MSAEVWYLDTSALVKTVVRERESAQLGAWLRGKELVASDLVRVETVRAVRVSDSAAVPRAREAIATLTLIRLDDDLLELAAGLEPPFLRSLDAIHLAAALGVGSELEGIVTYDRRMAEGADALGLRVAAPGRRTGRAAG
jgi:predicted nucleic acid-binding protein